jgi:hypothetical protein
MPALFLYRKWLTLLMLLAIALPAAASQPAIAAPQTRVTAALVAAPVATITLTPVADAVIDSGNPTVNFGQADELQVANMATLNLITRVSLIRFDLSLLPAGAVINRAELHLHQTRGSGDNWTVNINHLNTTWGEESVTWGTRPFSSSFYAGLPVPDPGAGDPNIVWDVTDLARTWAYNSPALNHGLEIVGTGRENQSLARAFGSRESATPPELVIDYTPPPTSVVIPADSTPVTLDGRCEIGAEYARATVLSYVDVQGATGTAYLKHDADAIYVCFVAPAGTPGLSFFGVYLDTDLGREKYATEDDYGLHVDVATGETHSLRGTGDPAQVYEPVDLGDWKAVASSGNADSAEYLISRTLFNRTCTSPFGLALYHRHVRDQGDDYGLPPGRAYNFPDQWLEATLENPGCIRVCSETATPCGAAPGATVRNTDTGTIYPLDGEGYVINRDQIANGAPLWALLPVSSTARSTLYHTSGAEQTVNESAFSGSNAGTMTLVVSQQNPLLVQNLDVAAQWYVEGDAERTDWLRENIVAASDFLYRFTDGQFALGRVTVQQSYDGWDDADLQLHANNIFQPRADIGGIVITDTVDLDPSIPITYAPGQMYMGSHWNRYGKPPGEEILVGDAPVPAATMAADWAIALAHELGHYLLFLFDVYTDIDGNASAELAEQCTLSAMGDAYKPSNHAFIYDRDHWDAHCSETEAYTTLGGRTEWRTINLWHPWTITPTAFVTGPVLPAGVTSVTFITPTIPPGPPATSQVFDLVYQDNETNSAEARGFLLRNNRVLEQGKPPQGANQIHLIDAQQGDRLCVYDINDNAEGDETPRNQFGCKIIVPGDATLEMTKDVAWAPLVDLRQTGANQLTVAVTQPVTLPVNVPIQAALYPEHGEKLLEVTLTGDGSVHTGAFNLAENVPPVYVQLFVSETVAAPTTRREVIVDRGTGGSGAYGPARMGGKVLVISSDGNASYESDEPLTLEPGESIAWQSMPGTPPLPPGLAILGQSYRLDAFPPSLVVSGTVSIRFVEPSTLVNAANTVQQDQPGPTLYFWDGIRWERLDTSLTKPIHAADGEQLASARSRGIGVYTVMVDQGQAPLLLPLIYR